MGSGRFSLNVTLMAKQGSMPLRAIRINLPKDALVLDLYSEISKASGLPIGNFLLNKGGRIIDMNDSKLSVRDEYNLEDLSSIVCHVHDAPVEECAHVPTGKDEKLLKALMAGDLGNATILLESGANPNTQLNKDGTTLMDAVCLQGLYYAAKLLYKFGAKVHINDETGSSTMHAAAASGSLSLLQWLVGEANGSATVTIHSTGTLLHIASAKGYLPMIKWLVEKQGLDVDDANNVAGATPLMLACLSGASKVVKWLIEEGGADMSARNLVGVSALDMAITENRFEVADVLIKAGAPVDIVNIYGQTALHLASACGRLNILKLLLDKGAKPDHCDKRGRTPNDVACIDSSDKSNKSKIQEALKESLSRKSNTGLEIGGVVRIKGLAKKPEYNGLEGKIQSFVAKTSRYAVEVETKDGATKVLSILPKNLTRVGNQEEIEEAD